MIKAEAIGEDYPAEHNAKYHKPVMASRLIFSNHPMEKLFFVEGPLAMLTSSRAYKKRLHLCTTLWHWYILQGTDL